jgi:hypothetical protein
LRSLDGRIVLLVEGEDVVQQLFVLDICQLAALAEAFEPAVAGFEVFLPAWRLLVLPFVQDSLLERDVSSGAAFHRPASAGPARSHYICCSVARNPMLAPNAVFSATFPGRQGPEPALWHHGGQADQSFHDE